jgi:hypothetical protein
VLLYCLHHHDAPRIASEFNISKQSIYRWWDEWHDIPQRAWVLQCSKIYLQYEKLMLACPSKWLKWKSAQWRFHYDATEFSFIKYLAQERQMTERLSPVSPAWLQRGIPANAKQVYSKLFEEKSRDIAEMIALARRAANL